MTCDTTLKRVNSLREQNVRVIQELAIIVLVLQLVHFVVFWFADLWEARPLVGAGRLPIDDAKMVALQGNIPLLILTSFLLLFVVLYFFRLRNRPQFHAYTFGRAAEPMPPSKKRALSSFSVLGTSIGLAFTGALYYNNNLFNEYPWWHYNNHNIVYPFYPLIIVVCVSVFLYFLWHVQHEPVKRMFSLLLFVPIVVSIWVTFQRLIDDALNYYKIVILPHRSLGGPYYLDAVVTFSYQIVLLTCFIVLLYLTYYYTNVERKKTYTHIEGMVPLQGLVEEAVWVLPQKVRENDSHSASLELKLSKDFTNRGSHVDKPCSRENFSYASSDYLEAELQAVGLLVDGEKHLRICETSPLPVISWSCSFTKSGIHSMNLMISVVKPPDNSRHLLFMQSHNVQVDSFLTISLLPILTLIMPILAVLVQIWLRA